MYRLPALLFILIASPVILRAQEIITTSRYEKTVIAGENSSGIGVLREKYGIPAHVSIISPSFGADIVLEVYRTDFRKASGSPVLLEKYSDILRKDTAEYYMLFNKEPAIIGGHAYSFDVNGTEYEIHYIKNGLVATYKISANEAFLSQDGYLLKVWRQEKK